MAFSASEPDPFSDLIKESMAESVTCHALISEGENFYFLLCGIDSLDLGFYVSWAGHWESFRTYLQESKDKAMGSTGHLDQTLSGRKFLHLPSGKPPNYRYHLQFPEYHAYIAIANHPGKSPNVYVSLNASALWGLGLQGAVDQVILDLTSFQGTVCRIVPSRLDLCCDYLLPGGLSLDFLQQHAVARSRAQSSHINSGVLETFYSGSPGAPIRLRIYDKTKEIKKTGKFWFEDLWGLVDTSDVWRVEYQMRRSVLKQFGLNSIEDLAAKLGGLWEYLSENWFSLRHQDNDQQNRRSVLPWWGDVQTLKSKLGSELDLHRTIGTAFPAAATWFISHISGCLPSFAARIGAKDFNEAVNLLNNEMCQYWFEKNFRAELAKRQIKQAHNPELEEESDVDSEN